MSFQTACAAFFISACCRFADSTWVPPRPLACLHPLLEAAGPAEPLAHTLGDLGACPVEEPLPLRAVEVVLEAGAECVELGFRRGPDTAVGDAHDVLLEALVMLPPEPFQ